MFDEIIKKLTRCTKLLICIGYDERSNHNPKIYFMLFYLIFLRELVFVEFVTSWINKNSYYCVLKCKISNEYLRYNEESKIPTKIFLTRIYYSQDLNSRLLFLQVQGNTL